MYIVHAPSTPCTIRIYICVCVLNRIIRRVNVCVYRPFAETFRNILSASVRAVARSSSAACENGGSYIYIHNLTVLREGRCVRMFRKGNARTRVNDITHAGRTSSSLLNRPFTSRSFIKARIISRNLYTLSLRCPPPPSTIHFLRNIFVPASERSYFVRNSARRRYDIRMFVSQSRVFVLSRPLVPFDRE